jgi:hypothetical protein
VDCTGEFELSSLLILILIRPKQFLFHFVKHADAERVRIRIRNLNAMYVGVEGERLRGSVELVYTLYSLTQLFFMNS